MVRVIWLVVAVDEDKVAAAARRPHRSDEAGERLEGVAWLGLWRARVRVRFGVRVRVRARVRVRVRVRAEWSAVFPVRCLRSGCRGGCRGAADGGRL